MRTISICLITKRRRNAGSRFKMEKNMTRLMALVLAGLLMVGCGGTDYEDRDADGDGVSNGQDAFPEDANRPGTHIVLSPVHILRKIERQRIVVPPLLPRLRHSGGRGRAAGGPGCPHMLKS